MAPVNSDLTLDYASVNMAPVNSDLTLDYNQMSQRGKFQGLVTLSELEVSRIKHWPARSALS